MEKNTDQAVLYKAYKKYQDLCKGKPVTAKQQSAVRNDLFRRADRLVLFLNSPSTGIIEKNKLLKKCKPLYQQYCSFIKGNPGAAAKNLENKIEQLIQQMSVCEAEQVRMFRKRETGGDRLDIEAIFLEESNIKQLVSMQIDYLLSRALQDQNFTIISRTDQKVFITESGLKYHRANCPYCRGRTLISASFTKVKNAGYTPCRCIGSTDKVLIRKEDMSEEEKVKLGKETMTAFIDESVRDNPWRHWDNSISDKQSSYSYIICKGRLESEKEITNLNMVSSNACLANEATDVTMSAIEAISAVLLKIAFGFDFHGDVLIYTDNMAAKDKWYKNAKAMYLTSLFESVKVCHIPREKNTAADAVGRKTAFVNIPSELVGRLVNKCKNYDKQKEELDFVKTYFPQPKKNIPNLVNELRLIAQEKK